MASSAGVRLGSGLTGKLGRVWVGAWVSAWVHGSVHGSMGVGGVGDVMGGLRPSLPVNQDPNRTPASEAISGLHYMAADVCFTKMKASFYNFLI